MSQEVITSHTLTHTHSNGTSVEGADHQTVVQLIRYSGDEVSMVVVSVTEDEARRLEPDSGGGSSSMDYYERKSVPVSIPDTQKMKDESAKEYVVYNIYLANKKVASRRYRDFDALNNNVSVGIQPLYLIPFRLSLPPFLPPSS